MLHNFKIQLSTLKMACPETNKVVSNDSDTTLLVWYIQLILRCFYSSAFITFPNS